jgi:hypothetical protein
MVTPSLAEYEALALKLAAEQAALSAIRDTCSLCHTERFCRNLEAAYHTIWEGHQNGQPPQSFTL